MPAATTAVDAPPSPTQSATPPTDRSPAPATARPTETRDQRAERLLRLGLDVATRIRDDDPALVIRSLEHLDLAELRETLVLVAACVPVDLPTSVLLGWFTHPRYERRPCGSTAAARRHRANGEPLDPLCAFGEREGERVRQRERRAAA